ncbi:MAG: TetR/AcrR family transcriptional regulator [Bdellovibrionota bacterium]
MKKTKKVASKKISKTVTKKTVTVGRKRDDSLDDQIKSATIEILGEIGFDRMTMDMVSARVGAGKASLYRRWPSKAELVKDSLVWMSGGSVDLTHLPDTGSIRGDLLSVVKAHSTEYSERKGRILSKLGSFLTVHKKLIDETSAEIFEPWTEMNRTLMKRAIERGELSPKADVDLACEVIIAMVNYYSMTLNKPFEKSLFSKLLDNIIIPSMKK